MLKILSKIPAAILEARRSMRAGLPAGAGLSGLVGGRILPNSMFGGHAALVQAQVGVSHSGLRRRRPIVRAPNDMVGHGLELLPGTARANWTSHGVGGAPTILVLAPGSDLTRAQAPCLGRRIGSAGGSFQNDAAGVGEHGDAGFLRAAAAILAGSSSTAGDEQKLR